jgi:hypothetical protein
MVFPSRGESSVDCSGKSATSASTSSRVELSASSASTLSRSETTTRAPGLVSSTARLSASAGSACVASESLNTTASNGPWYAGTSHTSARRKRAPESFPIVELEVPSNCSAARSSIKREWSKTKTCVAPFCSSARASLPVSAPTTSARRLILDVPSSLSSASRAMALARL